MFKLFNPRQTVLVSSTQEMELFGKNIEKNNLIAVDWHMPLSLKPFIYAISIGKERFSLEMIRKSGVFVVNFMPFSFSDSVLFCGRNSGRHMDKFFETRLTSINCEGIECVKVKEAIAHLECEVIQEIEVGDHILFIAKVIRFHEEGNGKRLFHVEKDQFTTTID
jgi:flavin reductase (DIM6/NTAB) family NADH-FMN oxidoreductase RutF